MPRSALPVLLETVPELVRMKAWDGLLRTLRQAAAMAQTRAQCIRVFEAWRGVPLEVQASGEWRVLSARIAYRAGETEACRALLEAVGEDSRLDAFRAWVAGSPASAFALSERALEGEDAGVAWRVRARAAWALRVADWREHFVVALEHLVGRQRGLCFLEFGVALTRSGEDGAARSAYAQSLPLLKADRYFAAMVNYNIAVACLRLNRLEEAARHAHRAWEASSSPEAFRFRSRAWSGLGAVQRARGEMPRALWSYEQAKRLARDDDDHVQASRGHAHAWRLRGEVDEALAKLFEALTEFPTALELHADIAVTKLQLNDLEGARESLRVLDTLESPLGVTERDRVTVARAELLRRDGDVVGAAALLSALEARRLWVLEESVCFPALFALIGLPERSIGTMRVRVHLDGPVRVFVNDCSLESKLSPRVASLLAFLVCHHGTARDESLMDGLGEDGAVTKKRLYQIAEDVRTFLGWQDAVTRVPSGFELARDVAWVPVLPSSTRAQDFCEGLTDEWVKRWRLRHEETPLTVA